MLPWLGGWGWPARLAATLALDRALALLAALARALVPRDPWLAMPDGRRERLSEVSSVCFLRLSQPQAAAR